MSLPLRMLSPLMLAWLGCVLPAEGAVIWQLGVVDESSGEFSHWRDRRTGQRLLDYADPAQDVVFEVGRDDPARRWFSFQPGTANGLAGFRPHPFRLKFDLPEAPAEVYRLQLHLLAYSVRVPAIQVAVNGERGVFHQRPELTYTAGDQAVFYLPHYARSKVSIDVPASALRAGSNELVITPVDGSEERDDAQPSGFTWPGVSGLVYDALSFEQLPAPPAGEPAPQVEVRPTPFYVQAEGALCEQVEVLLRLGRWPAAGKVVLKTGGRTWTQPLPGGRNWGEARLRFYVPEFPKGTRFEIELELDGVRHPFPQTLDPARKWELYLVPNQHLDVGYTDYAAKVAELQSNALDQALDLMEQHPDFRYTVDGFWVIEQFMRGRTEPARARLLRQAQAGRLSIPAGHSSPFTGFASLENLIRSLYPGHQFAREHGLPFDHALITDVPSYSWSWASVLAASGVKYFVAASDAYRAPFLLQNYLHTQSPLAWEGPDGGKVAVWYSRHYHQAASLFGMPPRTESAAESLPRFLQAYDHAGYSSDAVILYGTQVENIALYPQQAAFAAAWAGRFTYPKIRYASFPEAMDRITHDHGGALASHRGDGGPYWEDGLGANARATALARRNMQRARSAEIFSTVASLVNPRFQADPTLQRQVWENQLLVDEHTWHADVSVSDPDSQQSRRQGEAKDARGVDARRAIDHLLGRALATLSAAMPNPAGTLVVFNSLNWVRTGWVETDIPKGIGVVDLVSGERVALEQLYEGNAFQHVRFLAKEVPAVGYRCFSLRPFPIGSTGRPVEGPVLENAFYRVTLDPASGGIRSWWDKETGRELVQADAAFRLNQHLYVTGADALPNRLVQYSTVAPVPELTTHAASGGRLVGVTEYPFGLVARLEATNLLHPRIETTVILHAREKKLELINRVTKIRVRTKEAAYFAFPFAMPAPRLRYGIQNGFVDPARDALPGAGREWFCVQDWVNVEQAGSSVTLVPVDAPLITLGDIARGTWPREFGARRGTVHSYVMNNYTPEGYQAGQGGEFEFRYMLTSGGGFDAAAAARFGAEALAPLEINEITRNDKVQPPTGPLDPARGSFLSVTPASLQLVTWKRAESGPETVLRLVETGGQSGGGQVRSPLWGRAEARRANAVEEPAAALTAKDGRIEVPFRPFEILTLRVGEPGQIRPENRQ